MSDIAGGTNILFLDSCVVELALVLIRRLW
jgi:hypothetical protein